MSVRIQPPSLNLKTPYANEEDEFSHQGVDLFGSGDGVGALVDELGLSKLRNVVHHDDHFAARAD